MIYMNPYYYFFYLSSRLTSFVRKYRTAPVFDTPYTDIFIFSFLKLLNLELIRVYLNIEVLTTTREFDLVLFWGLFYLLDHLIFVRKKRYLAILNKCKSYSFEMHMLGVIIVTVYIIASFLLLILYA